MSKGLCKTCGYSENWHDTTDKETMKARELENNVCDNFALQGTGEKND